MGIYMGVRKVWPFKCQNGPFIYFKFFIEKGGLYLAALKKGGVRALIRSMSYIGS